MPAGAPFESHVEPYSQIRVDDFTNTTYRPAWINLLSHIHSDHTQGLSTPSFSSQVVCSKDSKNMLLLLESVDNRIRFDNGAISQRKRTFAALQRTGKNHRDLLLTLPLNVPTKLDIGPSETAIVTLLDANHCPGSVMFLIEGKRGAILHTGDIRAEPAMVSRLRQNAHIAPYLCTNGQQKKQLEAVYLDTSSLIGTQIVPSKASAVEGLVDMIAMYPEDTLFYINAWTWGYEDILVGIADRFNTKIHVDRHKYLVLCSVEHYNPSPSFGKTARSDIFKRILTCDEHETRFHACERYNQCTTVKPADPEPKRRTHRDSMVKKAPAKRVVWINPGVVASSNWEPYIQEVKDQLKDGQFVGTLKVPLSRHSTLTELQSFVSLLRPKNIYPTTLVPSLEGLDWACLPGIFAECLTPDGYETLRLSALDGLRKRFPGIDITPEGMAKRVEQVLIKVGHPDLEQENAVGSDEIEWTEARFQRATKTKEHIETYLPWLFGRQDIPNPEPQQDAPEKHNDQTSIISPTNHPTNPPIVPQAVADIKPRELCSTCANCLTCRPKPLGTISANNSRVKARTQEILPSSVDSRQPSLPDTGSSTAHIADVNVIPAQRNGQMYSPPQSPELRPNLGVLSPKPNATTELTARPKKRLRSGLSTSTTPNSAATFEPPDVIEPLPAPVPNRIQDVFDFPSLASVRSNLPISIPNNPSESIPIALNVSGETSHQSPIPNDNHQANSARPTKTVAELSPSMRLPRIARSSNDIVTVPPMSASLPTITTRGSVSLSESDARERRRISKVKERDIRAKLAKLPPEFSQALAATKSVNKPR